LIEVRENRKIIAWVSISIGNIEVFHHFQSTLSFQWQRRLNDNNQHPFRPSVSDFMLNALMCMDENSGFHCGYFISNDNLSRSPDDIANFIILRMFVSGVNLSRL
jgi:hypothetical protein